MSKDVRLDDLIVPVYINEKIVLDMLAIIDDGFSKVSQVNYNEMKEGKNTVQGSGGTTVETPQIPFLGKLLKIDVSGDISHEDNKSKNENITTERVHTNVSLLSKFRSFLAKEEFLKTEFDIDSLKIGDFIEVKGELKKNPLIEYMDIFTDIFRVSNIFEEKPELGNKTTARKQKKQEDDIIRQIKDFNSELKHSGTIDFIVSDQKQQSVVLSAQEQYLENDNISEIIGGKFRVLGKVISIVEEGEEINLLRKTLFSIFGKENLQELFQGITKDMDKFDLPNFVTDIKGPAVIVIPIAIYA